MLWNSILSQLWYSISLYTRVYHRCGMECHGGPFFWTERPILSEHKSVFQLIKNGLIYQQFYVSHNMIRLTTWWHLRSDNRVTGRGITINHTAASAAKAVSDILLRIESERMGGLYWGRIKTELTCDRNTWFGGRLGTETGQWKSFIEVTFYTNFDLSVK